MMFRAAGAALALTAFLALGAPGHAGAPPDSFANLADKLIPAVVNISTIQIVEPKSGDTQINPGDSWQEWFRDYFDNRRQEGQDGTANPRKKRQTSLGSGFIVDSTGYIVTNNHVVEDADQITVTLHDDSVLEAKVVGRDSKIDIALLKVEPKSPLPTVPWGNSDKSRVGDWVVAIGNPFGLGGTVTVGIVSARAREIGGNYDDFIQTDASINKGNSGGPLFNLDGQVIGVNSAIFSPSGGSVGIGFAASSNSVRPVLDDLRKFGRTRRGWIGVSIQGVNEDIASTLGLQGAHGALVSMVADGGPAAKAGIEAGDVIVSFDGKSLDKYRELPRVVGDTDVDKTVDVKLWRKGTAKTLKIKVAELEDEETTKVASVSPQQARAQIPRTQLTDLGITVSEISDATRQRFDIPASVRGLVVVDVTDTGDAADKLKQGDVIDEIQQVPVTTTADAQAAIATAKKSDRKVVLLRVQSGDRINFVAVKIAG